MIKLEYPTINKKVQDFIYEEEGNIGRDKVLLIGSMLIILASMFPTKVYAAHRSHSSHSSHTSSSRGAGHESHQSHQSHQSHVSSGTGNGGSYSNSNTYDSTPAQDNSSTYSNSQQSIPSSSGNSSSSSATNNAGSGSTSVEEPFLPETPQIPDPTPTVE